MVDKPERCEYIDIMRHGEVSGAPCFRGSSDHRLSAAGEQTMQRGFNRFGPWDLIYSSPLLRCREPAEALSRHLGVGVVFDARLQEIDFGRWEGRSVSEIEATEATALHAFWQNPFRHPPPGGEDYATFEARVLAAWESIVITPQRRILLVTHGGVVRAILGHLLAIPQTHLMRLEISYSAVSRIRLHHFAAGGYLPALQRLSPGEEYTLST
ncbi:MAG: histidine phosphatase family protein [Gammaproteobacteria bacterium]|nr:histidine phosphatase family protein [Gammaproteobacteria bacterium]